MEYQIGKNLGCILADKVGHSLVFDKKWANKRLKSLGIRKAEFSQMLGVRQNTVVRLFNNEKRSIKFLMMERLCSILECTPNDLFLHKKSSKANKLYYFDLSKPHIKEARDRDSED